MLIAISKYIKPLAEIEIHRPAHLEYIKALFAAEKLLIAGRQNPPTGAVIIAKTQSRAEFEQIIANDPYTKAGVAEYNIIEFATLFCHDILAEFK